MQTRFATADDFESVASLYPMVQDSHASAYPHRFKSSSNFTRAAFEGMLNAGKRFLLAVNNGRVVGYALVEVLDQSEDSENRAHRSLLIHNMAISGGSAADALFDGAYAFARSEGIHEVELDVWAFNAGVGRWVTGLGYKPLRTRYVLDLK